MSTVFVKVKSTGEVYSGWTDVEVNQSLDDAASSFSLNTADIGTSIETGDPIVIMYDSSTLLTGIVDSVTESYSATSHDIQITGRSRTKDIIDCSASPQEWYNTKASTILNQLTKPYEIKVIINGADVTVPYFSVQKDSTEEIISAIHRLASHLKLIVTDNTNGDLVLTQAGKELSENFILNRLDDTRSNVLTGSYLNDESNRYSEIIVRSQVRGSDTNFGKKAQQITATATDEKNIKRKRTLIIDASEPLSQSEAQDLADWQIAYNTGKSVELQYTVQDWFGVAGIWQLNTQVRVTDDFRGVDNTYLITQVRFSKSSSGTITDITLHPVSAYIPSPSAPALPTKSKSTDKKSKKKKADESISFEQYEKQG